VGARAASPHVLACSPRLTPRRARDCQIEERKRLHAALMERLKAQTGEARARARRGAACPLSALRFPSRCTFSRPEPRCGADAQEMPDGSSPDAGVRGLRPMAAALERSEGPPGSRPLPPSSVGSASPPRARKAGSSAGGAGAVDGGAARSTRRTSRAATGVDSATATPSAPRKSLAATGAASASQPTLAAPMSLPSLAPSPGADDLPTLAAAAAATLEAASAPDTAPACLLPPSAAGATAAADGEEAVEDAVKPLCKERLNVVMVAMECAPWSKTGGLGDVAGALPKALARRGHRTMCIAPRYSNYLDAWETGVRLQLRVCGQDVEVGFFHGFIDGVDYVFVDHPCFHSCAGAIYGGAREDLQFRCALLCSAALEAPWNVSCGGAVYGDENLVFLANDWHTALLPVFLQGFYRDHGKLTFARACLVIHNMAHQGRGPMDDFARLGLPGHWADAFRLDDPMGGVCMNVFKAGLLAAHRLIAVSRGYAWECATDLGGWGLAPVVRQDEWKLSGIVNGIDMEEWNPATDPHLAKDGYMQYTPDAEGLKVGKAACKAALQKELGLPIRPDVPLMGFIGRLDYQKGVDIICESAGHIFSKDCQLVMLGTGSADLEDRLRGMEAGNRDRCRGWVGFSVAMAHRITAGADILLMPSRFEPCGLNQLYAMRYGTTPIVHAVGGLRDTVAPFNPFENSGTGWTFSSADSWNLNEAVTNAVTTYRDYPESFRAIQLRAMAQDLSWELAAEKYEDIMLAAKCACTRHRSRAPACAC
jgi:starch synthase